MIPWLPTIAPFSRCWIGPSLTTDKRSRQLARIREGLIYTSQLRRFLLNHPLLVIELGFHLALDSSAPYGFDCQKTLPSDGKLA
jgi:hypothetical protein